MTIKIGKKVREFCLHTCPEFCVMKFAFCVIVPESLCRMKVEKIRASAKFYPH